MVRRTGFSQRRGAVAPLVGITLLAMMLFVSLAVDLGVIAVAHSQCQNAADSAAIAGARTLNGKDTDNNYVNAGPAATTAAEANSILRVPITAANLATGSPSINTYDYDYTGQAFNLPSPATAAGTAGANWTACSVTIQTGQRNYFFGQLFNLLPGVSGVGSFQTAATATAVHRPRDVGMICDMTGSMGQGWILDYNNNESNNLQRAGRKINDDGGTGFPNWGQYTSNISGWLNSGDTIDNRITDTSSGTSCIQDFWQHVAIPELATSGGTKAFTAATAGNASLPLAGSDTIPGGTATTRLKDLTVTTGSAATTYLKGIAPYSTFKGYSKGPGYWGSTFFMWPPYPNQPGDSPMNDWRQKFFYVPATNLNVMWDGSGNLKVPSGTAATSSSYAINYTAIANWIQTNNICPPRLRCGRMQYYSGFPTSGITPSQCWHFTPVGGWDVWAKMAANGATNEDKLNQRFWMEYIDWSLGFVQTAVGTYSHSTDNNAGSPALLFGPSISGSTVDLSFGTNQIAAYDSTSMANSGGPGVNATDNPRRPALRYWFGPLSLMDFCLRNQASPGPSGSGYNPNGTFGSYPGNIHQPQLWCCKRGLQAALNAMQNNHPNDYVACAYFSQPFASGTNGYRMNAIRAPLGGRNNNDYLNSYKIGQMCLWCPPLTTQKNGVYCDPFGTGVGDISAFDQANTFEGPAAGASTAYAYPLMLIYNQFSTNQTQLANYATSQGWANAPPAQNGGYGRRGATKIVILETDGAPNTLETATLVPPPSGSPTTGYYPIRQKAAAAVKANFELPASTGNIGDNASAVTTQIYSIISSITADEASGGYSTNSRPVMIYAIGFDDSTGGFTGPDLTTLNTVAQMGRTGSAILISHTLPLTSANPATTTKVTAIRDAFTKILQDTVTLVLLQ